MACRVCRRQPGVESWLCAHLTWVGVQRLVFVVTFLEMMAGAMSQPSGKGELWPECQEHGRVLRHAGVYGLFTDLTAVGAKEGCWLSDCTKTDKFICPSPADCGIACSRTEGCAFWTYEPPIRKCFLRSSDAGREEDIGFVSGSRACRPDRADKEAAGAANPAAPGAVSGSTSRVGVPFAKAALWAAELPALKPCNDGVGAPGCENPYGAMGVWRYAVNNLRLAVAGLPDEERARHRSTLGYVGQISADVANFYSQPSAETFQVAVGNALAVFGALKGWLQTSPPTETDISAGMLMGAPDLPVGRLAAVSSHSGAGLAAARVQLANGREMPLIGFGTWQLVGQQAYEATIAALQAGYRHIDTAQAYMNEREVGLAIRDSGVPRADIFIATKISDPAEFAVLEQRLAQQLAALGTDYLDLYMLHSPGDQAGRESAWRSMEALHDRGLVRCLGVSNFGPHELEELLAFARIKPVYLQNKFSVYNPGEQQVGGSSQSVLAYARARGIAVMGYSVVNPWPFMLPPMEDPHVRAVAARYGRSPAQILHRWALQSGAAVIPKSASPARIAENARLLDFALSELDMRLLNGLVTLSESTADAAFSPAWADDVYGLGRASF